METSDNTTELWRMFTEFVEKRYYAELLNNIRQGKKYLVIDFRDILAHDLDMADALLANTEETIKIFERLIEEFDIDGNKDIKVRFKNLPDTCRIKIVDNRVAHLNKLVRIVGEVSRKSKVYIDTVSVRFECPTCNNIINILQITDKFREPSMCSCGRKGKFTLIDKERVDIQELTIIDSVENVEQGDMYQELTVILKDDLTSPDMNKKVYAPNNAVIVSGYFVEQEITRKDGAKSRRSDKIFIANYVESVIEQDKEFYPTHEEIGEFRALSKGNNYFSMLLAGVAPTIYGHDDVKEALLLQLVGGVRRKKHGDKYRRGDIHIALIGDSSTGKSEIILRATDLLPKSMFVVGKGSSAVGIAGGVKKNAYVDGFTADPGAMAMANHSILGVDELDKFEKDDVDALNLGMEQQFIKIDKGGVHARYEARTRVIIGANPKHGRFDIYSSLPEQFGIKPSTLSRLDLIFPMQDIPDVTNDERMASFILDSDTNALPIPLDENIFYETNKMRKFIQAVTRLEPEFSAEAKEEIKSYYVKMRSYNNKESGLSAIAISVRQLQALERLAEASAKIFFRKSVSREDAQRAISLMDRNLKKLCTDPETGKVDIDRIITGISTSERIHYHDMLAIIDGLIKTVGNMVSIEDIIAEAKNRSIPEDKVEETIERLKRTGDIAEIRRGFISKI